jgi:hypothetical protein
MSSTRTAYLPAALAISLLAVIFVDSGGRVHAHGCHQSPAQDRDNGVHVHGAPMECRVRPYGSMRRPPPELAIESNKGEAQKRTLGMEPKRRE